MLLGTKAHTAGNSTRYSVDYSNWLEEGGSLASGTAVLVPQVPALTDVTISQVSVTPSNRLVFWVQGGSLNEKFTVALQAVDSRGEIVNDTAGFYVIAP